MRFVQSRLAAIGDLVTRRSKTVLLVILLAVGFCSVLHAIAKPFWFDELCTLIVARLPSASDIWKALSDGADGNPPGFHLTARWARQLVPDDYLGYRLPSIVGLLGTISCLYFILSKRADQLSALLGAAFVLCTPLADYAYEARPYALVVGCIAAAVLAWQRIDESKLYPLALTISLAAAVSLHYYAIFVWPAFAVAELSVWFFQRRFRLGAWVAMLAGALPLLFFASIIAQFRRHYGQHFWAVPTVNQAFFVYSWLFNFGDYTYFGWTAAVGITVVLLYWRLQNRQQKENELPIEERALILMLLWFPVIAVAGAKLSHGGMTNRYMLPTVLGAALAVGYSISKVPGALRALLLILFLVNYALSSGSVVKSFLKGSLLAEREKAAHAVQAIIAQYDREGLPVAISSGTLYLQLAYYTPAAANRKLYGLIDRRAAVTFAGSDSVDLNLVVLRRYFPMQVEDFDSFSSRYRDFLLVSEGDWDWWPARLSHDGQTLALLSSAPGRRIYKVSLHAGR